jgi:hypothetical protein
VDVGANIFKIYLIDVVAYGDAADEREAVRLLSVAGAGVLFAAPA